jgi:hypothetical protein
LSLYFDKTTSQWVIVEYFIRMIELDSPIQKAHYQCNLFFEISIIKSFLVDLFKKYSFADTSKKYLIL